MKYHNSAAWNGTSYWEKLKKKNEPAQKELPLGKISYIWVWSLVRVGQNLILLSPTFDPDIWKLSLSQTEGSFLFYFKYFIEGKLQLSTIKSVSTNYFYLCTCSEL